MTAPRFGYRASEEILAPIYKKLERERQAAKERRRQREKKRERDRKRIDRKKPARDPRPPTPILVWVSEIAPIPLSRLMARRAF